MDPLLVVLCLAAALPGLILWQWSRRSCERSMAAAAGLARSLSGIDWLRSAHRLVNCLGEEAGCRSVVLLALSDAGSLELRASAASRGEQAWDPSTDPGARVALEQGRTLPAIGGGVLIPVLEEAEPIGLLAVRGLPPGSPLLAVAARLSAVVLTGVRHYQRQLALSNTDGLTGLGNHRHFQQMLSVALGQAYLEGESLALILLDIDRFKQVNDTYGHLLGDLVLREIAYLLRRELPAGAVAARYGGEEMAVLLQGDQASRAVEVAEQIRRAIERHQIFDFASGTQLAVTVSLGVALYELGQGKNRLIARADEAMYNSKRDGRNRLTLSPPDGTAVNVGVTQSAMNISD